MIALIDSEQNISSDWDVVVIGAGLAGGLSALLHARAGLRTLLIEAKTFPRNKVCGCCLNSNAWTILERHGLSDTLLAAGSVRLNTVRLSGWGNVLSQPLSGMHALGRDTLDQTLVDFAVAAGACFLPATRAKVGHVQGDKRSVLLHGAASSARTIWAAVVVCADGLGHPSLGDTGFVAAAQPGSRFGLGATFASADYDDEHGVLSMIIGEHGYVGLTRIDAGRLNLAAAVEPRWLTKHKVAGEAIRAILSAAGQAIPEGLDRAQWTGTPALTRSSAHQAGERLFLIGDAAAYVEPFTGEGMAWALLGAELNAEFVRAAARRWDRNLLLDWERTWKKYVKRRQLACRVLSTILKSARLTRWSLRLGSLIPAIPATILRGINSGLV